MLPYGNILLEKNHSGDVRVGDFVPNTVSKGKIKVEDNDIPAGKSLAIHGNAVLEGNVQVFKNTGVGPKRVQFNMVGQNLQCKENSAPFEGTPNAAGKAEDQCS